MNVLIVDDEQGIREVIKEYCINEGYNIYEADNGLIAIEILEKEKIDIIILDIMMPRLDGIRTCLKIRENQTEKINPPHGENQVIQFDLSPHGTASFRCNFTLFKEGCQCPASKAKRKGRQMPSFLSYYYLPAISQTSPRSLNVSRTFMPMPLSNSSTSV